MGKLNLQRELEALFYTLYEAARVAGQFAPALAILLLVVLGGAALLLVFDVISIVVGRATTWPMAQTPRSIAGVAIFGGYFVWNRFANPEQMATLQKVYSAEPDKLRARRRLKVVALALVLFLSLFALAYEP